MKIIRTLLFPIVPIYYLVTWFRNILYDVGIKSSKSYDFPVICVGNLSTGGTGKTPMVEYLIKLLKNEKRLATLSRGYGRKTKGFLLANENASADSIGDEPFQFYSKFNEDVIVAVDENRQHGISQLMQKEQELELVILDDAYQHRKVKAKLNILLTTYTNPYFKAIVLPTGNLREPRAGAKRADIIVVTKCPERLTENDRDTFIKQIKPRLNQHIFFSNIGYSKTVISNNKELELQMLPSFTLVTGIANAKPLVAYLKTKALKFQHLEYKDHHHFSKKDIEEITKSSCVVTTEKDYMRLKKEDLLKDKLFYIPIVSEIKEAEKFNLIVRELIAN